MDLQELKAKLDGAEKYYKQAQLIIYKEYALANNPYKIGDVIKDSNCTIKIERITISIMFGVSQCVYRGTVLTAKGLPAKNQNQVIYQNNIL